MEQRSSKYVGKLKVIPSNCNNVHSIQMTVTQLFQFIKWSTENLLWLPTIYLSFYPQLSIPINLIPHPTIGFLSRRIHMQKKHRRGSVSFNRWSTSDQVVVFQPTCPHLPLYPVAPPHSKPSSHFISSRASSWHRGLFFITSSASFMCGWLLMPYATNDALCCPFAVAIERQGRLQVGRSFLRF